MPRSRAIVVFLTLFFTVQIVGGTFLYVHPAHAQDSVPTEKGMKQTYLDKAVEAMKKVASKSVNTSFYRVVMNYTQRLSAAVGKSLAEGGKGGKPGVDTRQLNQALKESQEAAIGDTIDAIGNGLGINLCTPPDLRLNLSLGLFNAVEPPKPSCTFSDLQKNWQNAIDDPNLLQRLNVALNPQNTEVGQALSTFIDATKKKEQAAEDKRLDAQVNGFFRGIESGVDSHFTLLPGQQKLLGDRFLLPDKPDTNPKVVGDLLYDLPTVALTNLIGAFTTTALQKLLQNGLFPPAKPKNQLQRPGSPGGSGAASSGGAIQPATFATVNLSQTGSETDLLSEMTSCPESGRNIYNCTLEQNFSDAIRQGLTVREAMDKGLLKRDLPFGYWGASGNEELRYDQGYPYANMKKLRRARIIPIGWELAAETVRALGKSGTTLQTVVDCFDDAKCSLGAGTANVFYRLVDPNWLLKAPLYSCRVNAPGALLTAGSDSRLDYCADLQDCVVPTEDGGGCKAWGYCTRERNVWRFDGQSCEPQYNTCTTYTRTMDNTQFSFNRNTLNYCTDANSVGCRWYATEKTGATKENWDPTKKIFLNRTAETCPSDQAGCKQFVQVSDIDGNDVTIKAFDDVVNKKIKSTYDEAGIATNIYLKGTRQNCRADTEDGNPASGSEATAKSIPTGIRPDANVGCERYTPKDANDLPVAAVKQAGDVCPVSCVGYDAYKEGKTEFATAEFPRYLIPSNARTCSADAVGCEEFTNLDATTRRGEAREYYTFMRQCQKPSTDSKTYFTWIGTDTTGYQLVTHSLKASNLDNGRAPCTHRDLATNSCDDKDDLSNVAVCVKGTAGCSEFYDAQGNITYRLADRTIISDDACVRYRKTATDPDQVKNQNNCTTTGGAWNASTNECTYLALPSLSRSCSAPQTGCREYTGNTANNRRIVFDETFENLTTPPAKWSAPGGESEKLSTNANVGGEHSIQSKNVGQQRIRVQLGNEVKAGKAYLLSFYAKGSGGLLPAFTSVGGPSRPVPDSFFARNALTPDVSLTDQWKEYRLGPVFVTWTPDAGEALEWNKKETDGSAGAPFYLDNVRLTEVQDTYFLIRNSWTTPSACKTPAEGAMAGCRAYTDRQQVTSYVRTFSQLCKDEFVGCKALIDTKNSASPYVQTFSDTNKDAQGNKVMSDDVTVSVDTIEYVVNDPAKYCAKEQKGCSALGNPASFATAAPFATQNTTVYFKNDPDKYQGSGAVKGNILCLEPDLGCEAYTKSKGGEDYFKDPGDKVCEWRRVPQTTDLQFGWFIKGNPCTINGVESGARCLNDASTKACTDRGGTCTEAVKPDCGNATPDGSTRPAGYARACPTSADQCTAFIDPNEKTPTYTEGRPYYFLDDSSLETKRADTACNGVVSEKAGCVLFKNMNKLTNGVVNVTYDHTASYANAKRMPCSAADGAACDANDLLKVRRDRVCGEWLSCTSGTQVFDKDLQALRNVCYSIGTCTEASATNAASCGNVKPSDPDPKLLDITTYQGRDITWKALEYAGYSIPYRYPASSYQQFAYGFDPVTQAPSEFRLYNLTLMRDSSGVERHCIKDSDCGTGQDFRCKQKFGSTDGSCYQDRGTGTTFAGIGGLTGTALPAIAKTCRAYPASDAPFPGDAVVTKWQSADPYAKPFSKQRGFEQANVSAQGQSAECSYERIRHKDGETRFWGLGTTLPARCAKDLDGDGKFTDASPDSCTDRSSVNPAKTVCEANAGTCALPPELQPDEQRIEYGWQGYCLEDEGSLPVNSDGTKHPCLTWFPVDMVQGEIDLNASTPEAGFQWKAANTKYYCVATQEYEKREFYTNPGGSACSRSERLSGEGCGGGCGAPCDPDYSQSCPNSGSDKRSNCTPLGGAGWYPYDGDTVGTEGQARTVCTKVALVENPKTNETIGWTEHLKGPDVIPGGVAPRTNWSTTSGFTGTVTVPAPGKNITYASSATPYGATLGLNVASGTIAGKPWEDGTTPYPLITQTSADKPAFTTTQHGGSPYATGNDPASVAGGIAKIANNIFARVFGVWSWNPAALDYELPRDASGAQNASAITQDMTYAKGVPPVIHAAKYNDKTQTYSEGDANAISVETWADGDRTFVNTVSQGVAVKFYAANPNGQQMPLRRVAVDWGDGTDKSVSNGAFKNHKNVCERYCAYSVDDALNPTVIDNSVDRIPAGQTGAGQPKKCTASADCKLSGFCNTAIGECRAKPKQCASKNDCGIATGYCRGPKQGQQCSDIGGTGTCSTTDARTGAVVTSGTCIANTCSEKNWGDDAQACVQDAIGAASGYFTFTHVYRCDVASSRWDQNLKGCVFVPKAQVLDNWGWCNGTTACDPKGGCYNDPLGATGPKGGIAQCDTNTNAWAPFKGRIILKP